MATVTILGKTYEVKPFGELYFGILSEALTSKNGRSSLLSFVVQSNVAAAIKEVIVPSVPEEVIYQNDNGNYVFGLPTAVDVASLIADLVGCYAELRIEDGDETKDLNKIVDFGDYYRKGLAQKQGNPETGKGFFKIPITGNYKADTAAAKAAGLYTGRRPKQAEVNRLIEEHNQAS